MSWRAFGKSSPSSFHHPEHGNDGTNCDEHEPKRRRLSTNTGPISDQFWNYTDSEKYRGLKNSSMPPRPLEPSEVKRPRYNPLDQQCRKRKAGGQTGRTNTRLKPSAPPPVTQLWENQFGHHVVMTGEIFWCVKCVSFGSDYRGNPQYLNSTPCHGPVTKRLFEQRSLLMAGRHPRTRSRLLGDTVRINLNGCNRASCSSADASS